jgi:hypothetical protein
MAPWVIPRMDRDPINDNSFTYPLSLFLLGERATIPDCTGPERRAGCANRPPF